MRLWASIVLVPQVLATLYCSISIGHSIKLKCDNAAEITGRVLVAFFGPQLPIRHVARTQVWETNTGSIRLPIVASYTIYDLTIIALSQFCANSGETFDSQALFINLAIATSEISNGVDRMANCT